MLETSLTPPSGVLYRVAAFTTMPAGGNPAGVWVGDALPDDERMQQVARRVGFSETAFVAPSTGASRIVRYFSPEAEVSFCGHATIAAGAVLGELNGNGTYRFGTSVGEVPVTVDGTPGRRRSSLTSVDPRHVPADASLVAAALVTLGWHLEELDGSVPPVRAYAGAWHLVLAASSAARLADLHYDFPALKALMLREGLTTLQLVWRERATLWHARNPFPVGGVVEDPATGAAAAALAGYLRDAGIVPAPARIVIRQGDAMGRPSHLTVDVPAAGGIRVTGDVVQLAAPEPA